MHTHPGGAEGAAGANADKPLLLPLSHSPDMKAERCVNATRRTGPRPTAPHGLFSRVRVLVQFRRTGAFFQHPLFSSLLVQAGMWKPTDTRFTVIKHTFLRNENNYLQTESNTINTRFSTELRFINDVTCFKKVLFK